jgi:hypothetical protein
MKPSAVNAGFPYIPVVVLVKFVIVAYPVRAVDSVERLLVVA